MSSYFKPNLKTLSFVSVCLLLSGCSTTKSTFDCQYGKGVGCRSITEVNEMVNNDMLGKSSPSANSSAKSDQQKNNASISQSVISADTTIVQRVTEEHLRVWIAPFQDEQGHFHEASIIHSVLRPGFWQVQEVF